MSLPATAPLMGVNRETVGGVAVQVGEGCSAIHGELMRGLTVGVLELDRIWSFIHTKAKRVKDTDLEWFGDCYVHTALGATSKAIISYTIGWRDTATASAFLADIRERVVSRTQITTDCHAPYLSAVESAFGADCDFARFVKHYDEPAGHDAADSYSPGRIRAIDYNRQDPRLR